MKKKLVGVLLGLMLMTACATKQIHPGALNAGDSNIYDTLLVSQAALNQAKTDSVNHPEVKPILNQAILSYNTALDSYLAYHAGKSNDVTTLQAQVAALVRDIAQLQSVFGKAAVKQ